MDILNSQHIYEIAKQFAHQSGQKYVSYCYWQLANTWNLLLPPPQLLVIYLTVLRPPDFHIYLNKTGIIKNIQKSDVNDI